MTTVALLCNAATDVLRHVATDLAAGFVRNRCTTKLIVHTGVPQPTEVRQALEATGAHFVVSLNAYRHNADELFPMSMPVVSWFWDERERPDEVPLGDVVYATTPGIASVTRGKVLPPAANDDLYEPDASVERRSTFVFPGRLYPEDRAREEKLDLIKLLSLNDIPFEIYGTGWPYPTQREQKHGRELARVYQSAIGVIHRGACVHQRVLESALCGTPAFMVRDGDATLPGGLDSCLDADERVAVPGRHGLVDALKHGAEDPEWCRVIGRHARARVLDEHLFKHRARTILKDMGARA